MAVLVVGLAGLLGHERLDLQVHSVPCLNVGIAIMERWSSEKLIVVAHARSWKEIDKTE